MSDLRAAMAGTIAEAAASGTESRSFLPSGLPFMRVHVGSGPYTLFMPSPNLCQWAECSAGSRPQDVMRQKPRSVLSPMRHPVHREFVPSLFLPPEGRDSFFMRQAQKAGRPEQPLARTPALAVPVMPTASARSCAACRRRTASRRALPPWSTRSDQPPVRPSAGKKPLPTCRTGCGP